MTSETLTRVVVTQQIAAPAERIFDAFLDVRIAQHFLFATATGEMLTAQLDARVGGRYEFTERRPEMGDVRHVGEYAAIERPRRLAFTFGVPQFDPRMTMVTIDIRSTDDGCEVTVTNEGVPEKYAERNKEGWGIILAGLLPAYDGIHGAGWR
jgi:uncharacterized protein YndB with AHSA1/START domain